MPRQLRFLLALLLLPTLSAHAQQPLYLHPLGTYATGIFDEGAAEIVAYDRATQQLFFVNADAGEIQALDISDPANPTLVLSITAPGGGVNSVAVTVGALPDALTFSEDGRYVVANEGEPNDDYTVDPEGSISVIDLADGVGAAMVTNVGFGDLTEADLDESIRIFGPGASIAQDLEPEYVAVHGLPLVVKREPVGAHLVEPHVGGPGRARLREHEHGRRDPRVGLEHARGHRHHGVELVLLVVSRSSISISSIRSTVRASSAGSAIMNTAPSMCRA